ncbi:MAG TPA: hypothetical protein VM142_00105 [Acidimicrobiales bacterium]|nr:hypothetical protein [Acidimicrobiales bacterium]
MSGGILPPYGEPGGTPGDDASVLDDFLASGAARADHHSDLFHIEGNVLMAQADVACAIRIGADGVLLRLDLPEDLESVKRVVEVAMTGAGMTRLDEETKLGPAVAIQLLGLRLSTWDLWGTDIDQAFSDLRNSAAGDPWA